MTAYIVMAFGWRIPLVAAEDKSVFSLGDLVVAIDAAPILDHNKREVARVWPGLVLTVRWLEGQAISVSYPKPGRVDRKHFVPLDRAAALRLTEMINAAPGDAILYMGRADVWNNLRAIDRAIADSNESIRLAPSSRSYAARGFVWLNNDQFDNAIADFDEALRLESNDTDALIGRCMAWMNKNELENALTDANAALQHDPASAAAHFQRGEVHRLRRDAGSAIAAFDEALRVSPHFTEAYLGRGFARFESGEYQQAIVDFTETIRHDPRNVQAHCNRADARHSLGQIDLAMDGYERTLQLDPEFAPAFEGRGRVWYDLHNFQEAIHDLSRAIRFGSGSNAAYFLRGCANYATGQLGAAIADCTEALRIDPSDLDSLRLRCDALTEEGDYRRAMDDAIAMRRLEPQREINSSLVNYCVSMRVLALAGPWLAGVVMGAFSSRPNLGFAIAWTATVLVGLLCAIAFNNFFIDALATVGQISPDERDRGAGLGVFRFSGLVSGLFAGLAAARIVAWKNQPNMEEPTEPQDDGAEYALPTPDVEIAGNDPHVDSKKADADKDADKDTDADAG